MARLFGSETLFRVVFNLASPLTSYFQSFSRLLNLRCFIKDRYKFGDYLTECPEDVSDMLIELFSVSGDTIMDPFTGSGTTLKSSIKLDRNCVGFEINKDCRDPISKKLNGEVIFE